MDWLLLVSAVTTANILTVAFVWGMAKAFKITQDDATPFTVVVALLMPIAFAVGGALLFGQ